MSNIVLTGFMASGKSAVGRRLAERLEREFIDLDELIVSRIGLSIPEIFLQQGETAFRSIESDLCRELSQRDGLVISTGGGTFVSPANRALFQSNSLIVRLHCSVEETLRRLDVEGAPGRPLLNVSDRLAEINRLLAARESAYAAIPWQIDTTAHGVEEIVEQMLPIVQSVYLPVRHTTGQYPIYISNGILDSLGAFLSASGLPTGVRVAVVANPTVAALYSQRVSSALHTAGYRPCPCTLPDGEAFKNLAAVESLYQQFLDHQLDRHDIILALGGGVTGDVAGFAAATYLRGLRFVQVPTTLLAMVDSSVGGKTGVDLPQGKNLVGAFKQPEAVIMDPTVLSTLPVEELRSGLVEAIKHGVIGDPFLFEQIESSPGQFLVWWGDKGAELLARAVSVKIRVVEEDPFESGLRATLNLGHTLGHAVEQTSGYVLRHGEAVGLGMIAAAHFAVILGLAQAHLPNRITSILKQWGLPVRLPAMNIDSILNSILRDKKKRGSSIRWVLPAEVGRVEYNQTVPLDLVEEIVQKMMPLEQA